MMMMMMMMIMMMIIIIIIILFELFLYINQVCEQLNEEHEY